MGSGNHMVDGADREYNRIHTWRCGACDSTREPEDCGMCAESKEECNEPCAERIAEFRENRGWLHGLLGFFAQYILRANQYFKVELGCHCYREAVKCSRCEWIDTE